MKITKDNRGSALVYVIVAAAIVVLLGAATTITAYVNLRSNQVQEKSDNNFYSADAVMNTIVSGLEGDVSKSYEAAYTQVITNLNSYPNKKEAELTFNRLFLKDIYDRLVDTHDDTHATYDVAYIQEYAKKVFKNDIRYTISAVHGDNFMEANSDSLILRNLHVSYENDVGYFDEITTDIKISIPHFNPDNIDKPSLQLNGLVVDDGLEVEMNRGLQVNANAYINERESDHNVILLNNKAGLTITTPEEAILGGHIKTKEDTYLGIKGTTNDKVGNLIYTENFDIGRYSDTDIQGQIFVYDDMEINGTYADVKLGGEYYGYSKSNKKAKESSALNVNGAHVTLNIENLDMLVLGGSSYISTSTLKSGNNNYTNSQDLQLGEGMSVKSNQIAYLVDDKEFTSNDVPLFVSNPMSYAQYEALVKANGSWEQVASKIANKKLSYGKSYAQFGASIMPVFSSKDNGTVYLYLSFNDPTKAGAYFTEAYRGNSLLSQKLRAYAAEYIGSLKLNPKTSLLVNENYIDQSVALYSSDDIFQKGLGYHQNKPDQTSMDNILNSVRKKYLDNGKEDGKGEKWKVMYKKLINQDKMKEFIAGATAANSSTAHNTNTKIKVVENGVSIQGTSQAKAIIVDNKGKEPFELKTGKGLVVVSGDLKITGDWVGTIIVGGRAYCTEGSKNAPLSVTADDTIVRSVLPLYYNTKVNGKDVSTSVVNIFKGFEDVKSNGATIDGDKSDLISNCLSFSNWNKH